MFEDLKKLMQILTKRDRLHLSFLLTSIIFMAIAQAVGVVSVVPFISLVMEPAAVFDYRWLSWAYESFGFNSIHTFTIFIGITMFFIILFSNAISACANWLIIKISWMNNHRLSKRLLTKYLAMPYEFFLNHNSADLSKNVLSEIGNLTSGYIMPLLTVITKSSMVLFIMIMLFIVDIYVSLGAIVLIGGSYSLIYLRVNKNLKFYGQKRIEANKNRYKTAHEAFGGIKEIKAANRESYFVNTYSQESLKHARYITWHGIITHLPRFGLELIAFGGIILYTLILLLTQEDTRQLVPLVSLFAFAGYRLMPAIQDIFNGISSMRFNHSVIEQIHHDLVADINTNENTEINYNDQIKPLTFYNEIKLENVSYNYPNGCYPVITDLNLTIRFNSSVAFVGQTGAGKTTLVDIILGLLRPQNGALLVDGQTIGERNIKNWQVNLGYVPQHIYLSDDTVMNNIAFGIPDKQVDHKAVIKAAQIANIEEFISKELPDGYSTLIGERGIRLSGGQRQRIGIARALYHDPAILIFDEATSALDGMTEDVILGAMQNIAKLKTLIIIAHRLTTVKNCDQIYMFDKGKIVASGSYEELLKSNKNFKAMAKII